jgi:hypothetical protein
VRSLAVATIGGGAATSLAAGGVCVVPGNRRWRELDSESGRGASRDLDST